MHEKSGGSGEQPKGVYKEDTASSNMRKHLRERHSDLYWGKVKAMNWQVPGDRDTTIAEEAIMALKANNRLTYSEENLCRVLVDFIISDDQVCHK